MKYDKENKFYIRDDFDGRILYESKNYIRLFENLDPGFNVLDIGAHIGTFSRLAAIKGAHFITCYEPYYPSFVVLKRNMEMMDCKIKAFPLAVGPKKDETATLYIQENPANNSLHKTGDPFDVNQIKFEDTLKEPFDVVKIDIEGTEYLLNIESLPRSVIRLAIEMHLTGDIQKLHNRIIDLGFYSLVPDIGRYIVGGRCVLGLYAR